MGQVASLEHLQFLKNSGLPVALCHGVFDVLHEGHLNYLEEAKKLAPILVVSVTADRFVNKGPGRPCFNQITRARMLAALNTVDYVIINDEPKATNVIKTLNPQFYVKGPDYKDKNTDITGGIVEEENAVVSAGGKMVFTDTPTNSSSSIINKVFNSFSHEQNETIQTIRKLGGIDFIYEIFKEIEKLYVTVVGEPIVDTYIFCEPEGISSKSPTISARYLREENYAGGSLAIANHLADFVKEVHLFAPHGREVYFQYLKQNQVDKRVLYHDNIFPNYVTPRKTRYIDADKNQRIFELTNINQQIWKDNNARAFMDRLKNRTKESHATLLCDFGHGLFEGEVLNGCFDLGTFTALNCQTNSSNFGFNPYTKHREFDYLSIDLKEARIAFHDRLSDSKTLFDKINSANVSMTLGPAGALYKRGHSVYKAPAFSDNVVDAIGAGDAYYAITSMLVQVGAPVEIIPFVGNMFAGIKTKIIGNKYSVTKAQLFKAINAVLK